MGGGGGGGGAAPAAEKKELWEGKSLRMSSQSHVIFYGLTDPNLNSLCMLFRLYTVYYFKYTHYIYYEISICAWFWVSSNGSDVCLPQPQEEKKVQNLSWEMGCTMGVLSSLGSE